VDTAHLRVIKAKDGALFIVKDKLELIPTRKICWKKCQGRPRCLKALLFARVRSLFAAARARADTYLRKLNFKGCPSKLRAGSDHRGGHSHNHQHKKPKGVYAVIHRLVGVLQMFVIPALLGLTAGVTACVIGMVIGHAMAAIWVRLRGRRAPVDQETGDDTEKEGLMGVDEDMPPLYQDEDENGIMLPAEKE
jgi:hypothetical protein